MSEELINIGPSTERLELENAGFVLVRESQWSYTYRRFKRSITFSKLLRDEFDWHVLEWLDPDGLTGDEKYDAAISIYVDNSNPRIPEVWKAFAIKICQ